VATNLKVNWLALGLGFVRLRPKTSVMLAFEIGILAAAALKKSRASARYKTISSKFIDLAPSMADVGSYSASTGPKRRRKPAVKRAPRLKKES
jgi:hypothetical protein